MKIFSKHLTTALYLSALMLLTACERPPVDSKQTGFRGTGTDLVSNPRTNAELAKLNELPPPMPLSDGPKAGAVYKNVKVLNNISAAQFSAFMVSMTSWVAPKEGCSYCHNVQNFADDLFTPKMSLEE
jgi:photosynthetic reaction center cytochrome c subunit